MHKTFIAAVLSALALGAVVLTSMVSSGTPAQPQASEHCIETNPTYILGRKVLPAGAYCVPV